MADLTAERALMPWLRMGGTGMRGDHADYFQYSGGREAILYVTDRRRVVVVPTTRGTLIVSPREPEEFLAALQEISGR